MKRGTELELLVDRVAEKGSALGHHEDRDVRVPFAVPGDRLRVRVTGRRKKRIEARIVEVLDPSPLRTEPRCRYFGDCGGCRWQNLIYPAQLDAKRQAVEDAFSSHGLLRDIEVAPTVETFKSPLHPYTKGLISSIPAIGGDRARMAGIPGNAPSPLDWPSGCRFHPRCPEVMDVCRTKAPEMLEVAPGRIVACHLYSKPLSGTASVSKELAQ